MSQDIAARIRAKLDERPVHVPVHWNTLVFAEVIRAVLDKCDAITVDIHGDKFWPGVFIADEFRCVIAEKLGITDSPAVAGSQPTSVGDTNIPNWHRIAVQIARYGGSYYGLRTWERDALEAEVRTVNEREWIDDDTARDRTADAASGGGECS